MLLPTNLLIGVGLVGVCLVATRFASLGRKFLITAVVMLGVCGFSPLGSWVLYSLESRFPPWDAALGAPDGIVVLGGSIDPLLSASHGGAVIKGAGDRMIAAATLARRYPNVQIVFTGGTGNLISAETREADYATELFEGLGISKQRLMVERESRNTYENAVFSKALAAPKSGERWLLVTSAYHMPRAVGLFRKAGFAVEPYPVDWRVAGGADLLNFQILSTEGLSNFDIGCREWMGLVAYWIADRSSELFPGPASVSGTSVNTSGNRT
jgi:uncharacterized SAM-binding protein YcdF (DUF218 family)